MKIQQNVTLGEKVATVFGAVMVSLIWAAFIVWIWHQFYYTNEEVWGDVNFMFPKRFGFYFMACVFAPLWEEVAFRVLPIQIARKVPQNISWPIILVASCIFGLVHNGVPSIMLQGVLGLLWSYVYIKNGYSYLSSFSTHLLYNTSLAIILPYLLHK
jgi:hypothetical protein